MADEGNLAGPWNPEPEPFEAQLIDRQWVLESAIIESADEVKKRIDETNRLFVEKYCMWRANKGEIPYPFTPLPFQQRAIDRLYAEKQQTFKEELEARKPWLNRVWEWVSALRLRCAAYLARVLDLPDL